MYNRVLIVAHDPYSLAKGTSPVRASKLQDTHGATLDPEDTIEAVLDDGETICAVLAAFNSGSPSDISDIPTSAVPTPSAEDDHDPAIPCSPSDLIVRVHAIHAGLPINRLFAFPRVARFDQLQDRITAECGLSCVTLAPYLFSASAALCPDAITAKHTLEHWGFGSEITLYCVFRPRERPSATPIDCSRFGWSSLFFNTECWQPSIQQEPSSLACFLSTLYVVAANIGEESDSWQAVFAHLRAISGFPPALLALYYLRQRVPISPEYTSVLAETFLFIAMHTISPSVQTPATLFSHSRHVWAHLFAGASDHNGADEVFDRQPYTEAADPVRLLGVDGSVTAQVFDRADVVAAITAGTPLTGFAHPQLHPYFRIAEDASLRMRLWGMPVSMRHHEVDVVTWREPTNAKLSPHRAAERIKQASADHMWQLADAEIGAHRFLRMVPALSLRSSVAPVLTWNEKGTTVVFTGKPVLVIALLVPINSTTPLTCRTDVQCGLGLRAAGSRGKGAGCRKFQ